MNDLDLLRELARPGAPDRRRAVAVAAPSSKPCSTPRRHRYTRAPRRRLATRVAVALVVTIALVTGGVLWARHETDRRLDAVGRIHVPKGTLSGAPGGKLPATFLIVGSDSREGLNDPAFGNATDQPGERADTMILLRVTRDGAAALWIPRDIVDATDGQKLNAGLSSGPATLIAALQAKLGVTIDRYVAVRFRGFERIVDALGGIRLTVPYPARDVMSGLDVPVAGCTSFDGTRALQFARSRRLEYLQNGVWTAVDPVPDIGRIGRQQLLVPRLRPRRDGLCGTIRARCCERSTP